MARRRKKQKPDQPGPRAPECSPWVAIALIQGRKVTEDQMVDFLRAVLTLVFWRRATPAPVGGPTWMTAEFITAALMSAPSPMTVAERQALLDAGFFGDRQVVPKRLGKVLTEWGVRNVDLAGTADDGDGGTDDGTTTPGVPPDVPDEVHYWN